MAYRYGAFSWGLHIKTAPSLFVRGGTVSIIEANVYVYGFKDVMILKDIRCEGYKLKYKQTHDKNYISRQIERDLGDDEKGGDDVDKCFYEVVATIRFSEDVPVDEVQVALAGIISNSMLFDEQLKELHHQNCFKPYVFCAPYPLEPDRIYRKGRMYCFHLRTLDLKFTLAMKKYLPKAKGVAKVISIELRNSVQSHISELVSLTPIISTVNNRCWTPENGLGLLAERLHTNALKKCKALDASFTAPEDYFFEHIEMVNQKPIIVKYKGKDTVLLGHKVHLSVKPYAWAQQLAFTALAVGLSEKNALGFGYCLARR